MGCGVVCAKVRSLSTRITGRENWERQLTTHYGPANREATPGGCHLVNAWSTRGQTRSRREAMDVGMMMVFASYGWGNIGDHAVWEK